jgi:hypothetical protein
MGHFNEDECNCPICLFKKVLKDNNLETDFILIIPDPSNIKDGLLTGTMPIEDAYLCLGHVRARIKEKLISNGLIEATKQTNH